MNTKTIRTLIADKNQDSRFALALLLDTRLGATVVGEAPTMEALLEQAAATHPDVVLLDWELPGRPEADRIVVLRSVVPEAQIIVISTRPESESQASDADGFVNKAAPPNTSWLL